MIVLMGLGGALGAWLRYSLGIWMMGKRSGYFPWATFAINLSGSMLLGYLAALHGAGMLNEGWWLVGGIGFCGSYTTFSTFGYEAVTLMLQRRVRLSIAYVCTSAILGIVAAWAGFAAASQWLVG